MSFSIEKVSEILSSVDKEDTVAILVQPNPDPDCLGAAAGIKLLLQDKFGLKSKVFYSGDISHPQNKSIVNVLNFSLSKADSFTEENYSTTIVLDTDLTNTGFLSEHLKHPTIRIDHHSMDRGESGELEDLRPVGATCSIVWDWLKEFEIDISSHADIATAMVLGIKTDTNDFSSESTSDLDFEAFRELIPLVDRDKLGRLNVYPLPKSLFDHESQALATKKVKNSILVSYVGNILPQKRDEIPIIADRFVRMDGVTTAVVLGIIERDLIASVRSTDSRVSVMNLCADVFGENFSGARAGCGGARVPLSFAAPVEGMSLGDEAIQTMHKELFKHYAEKIFSALGEE